MVSEEQLNKIYGMNRVPDSEVEVRAELLRPDARSANDITNVTEINGEDHHHTTYDKCPELMLKDLRIGNLNEEETKLAYMGADLLHALRYLTDNSGVDMSNAYKYFYNDLFTTFHISNSRDGLLSKLMVTHKFETTSTEKQQFNDMTQNQNEKKGVFSFMKKK